MAQVTVIGAGFAGLAAADELARAGLDVLVVEARDRVGGRVWSQELEAPEGSRSVIERGAEFVLRGYTTLEALAAQHDLALGPTGMSYYVREPRGIPSVDADGLGRAGRTVARAALEAGAASVADAVASAEIPQPLADAVLARVEISCALEAERLAPSVLDHVASFEPLPSHRLAGGNQRLARVLAASLGHDRLKLDTPVLALERRGKATRVLLADGELTAEQVVLALPLTVLRELALDPPLPGWKLAALQAVEVGHAAKLHIPLARAAPTSAVMSVPDRFWCWTATQVDGRVPPILNCFAGSPSALASLRVTDGPATWTGRVTELRPELALATEHAVLTTWDDDPWALGAYRADGLAKVDEFALEAAVDGLHFAGEYAAREMSGLMEGALRSGLRAAGEILATRSMRVSGAVH
jgi:monoamine oxidase